MRSYKPETRASMFRRTPRRGQARPGSAARAGRLHSSVGRARDALPIRRGGWALADQALSSGTNFALAIMLARLLAPKAYGSYVLAAGSWLMLLGLVRAVIVQPYTVETST